jgi:hypothetical protein
MKNKNNTPVFCLIISILIGINTLNGQNQHFKIGKIENWDSFLVLNEFEKKRIEFEKEANKEFDHLYSLEIKSLQGTTDSLHAEHYKKEVARRKSFEFNRSRSKIKKYSSNKSQNSTLIDENLNLIDCNCILDTNQIQIYIGMWTFGGSFVIIKIDEKGYSSKFIEDAHKTKPFKYSLKDTVLVNKLELEMAKKNLTLINEPKFKLNELIEGLIEFESLTYYVDSKYNNGLASGTVESMDEIKIAGKILFTCQLKKK